MAAAVAAGLLFQCGYDDPAYWVLTQFLSHKPSYTWA